MSLLYEDLEFHSKNPYYPTKNEPIHNWFMINESYSLKSIENLFLQFPSSLVIDPFIGSGTTALQSRIAGRHFIGFDSLSHRVICSLAKSYFHKANIDLLDIEDYLQMVDRNIDQGSHERDNALYAITWLNNKLIDHYGDTAELFILLTAIYSAYYALEDNLTVDSYVRDLRERLSIITSSLSISNDVANTTNSRIMWGNGLEIKWEDLLKKMEIEIPVNSLLITSPTYINSSMKHGLESSLPEKLAEELLQKETFKKYQTKSIQPTLGIAFEEYNNIPHAGNRYLENIYKMLAQFKSIAASNSTIIIDNENPIVDDMILDIDIHICDVASKIGLNPKEIKVTHYLDKDNKINYSRNGRRGSIIIIEV